MPMNLPFRREVPANSGPHTTTILLRKRSPTGTKLGMVELSFRRIRLNGTSHLYAERHGLGISPIPPDGLEIPIPPAVLEKLVNGCSTGLFVARCEGINPREWNQSYPIDLCLSDVIAVGLL